ncbi:hypothetical protein VMCG_03428 [Cytospora schulzeri]|uniref:Uncharacterized protein n=1 Tax=Cytospora schulzeri TaxID=448051 RepID=A0A423WWR3_9PEZI|nr:hypothetical protein VMCG_03428 [Valsa malicola]
MSSNDPPGGNPPRPSRRGGRKPVAQDQSPQGQSAFQSQSYQTGPASSAPEQLTTYTSSFAVDPSGPQTPSTSSFPLQQQQSSQGYQTGQSTGSQRSQPSPIGTPYQGSPVTAAELISRGSGGSAIFGKNKEGQYLEVIYPSAFLAIKRENNIIHLQEPYQIYYKYQNDPSPPSVEEWPLMVKKLDRLGRKIFFVHGTAKYAPAAIKELFPGIDTRTTTFQKLHQEYNVNMSQNLRRRVMWEDAFWSRDFPHDFRVDIDRYPANPANLNYTRHWIYEQMNEATYKRVWSAVCDVIPWANNFEDKNALQFWFLKTITAGLLQKVGPIAAAEQKMNPGVKWAKRGVKWTMAINDRKAAYDFLELQGVDARFRNIEMDTFQYATFLDENTASTPTSMPKRRAEDLRAQNAFISESPPPSPPHKTARHHSPSRDSPSADPFRSPGRGSMLSSGSRPRYASPLQHSQSATQGFGPGEPASGAQEQSFPVDPQLYGQEPRGSGRGPFDTQSGSTPRATRTAEGGAYPHSFESQEVRSARLERENRDFLARREAEIQEQSRQRMQVEIARLQAQYAQRSPQPSGPSYQGGGRPSQYSGSMRSPSLPPTTGPPPPSPQGIHYGSQAAASSGRPRKRSIGSQVSEASSALSSLNLGEGSQRGSHAGVRGSRPSGPQLGSGLGNVGVYGRSLGTQNESVYPLTPLQMQQAAAGVFSTGTHPQGSSTEGQGSFPTGRRTSGNFMAPTASSLTRSNSRRELRSGSAASGASTGTGAQGRGSIRSSTRNRRAPVSLAQEQEYNHRVAERERRRQAGERVDSPSPELGRGMSSPELGRGISSPELGRGTSNTSTPTPTPRHEIETMRAEGSFQGSRSQTYDNTSTQETETMRANESLDLGIDLDGEDIRPSEVAANYLNLHRASYN